MKKIVLTSVALLAFASAASAQDCSGALLPSGGGLIGELSGSGAGINCSFTGSTNFATLDQTQTQGTFTNGVFTSGVGAFKGWSRSGESTWTNGTDTKTEQYNSTVQLGSRSFLATEHATGSFSQNSIVSSTGSVTSTLSYNGGAVMNMGCMTNCGAD